MNYFRDNTTGDVFYATVILTDVNDLQAPPRVVRVADLFSGVRFSEVTAPEVAE